MYAQECLKSERAKRKTGYYGEFREDMGGEVPKVPKVCRYVPVQGVGKGGFNVF